MTVYLWNPEPPSGGIFDQMEEEDQKHNRMFTDAEIEAINAPDPDFCPDCLKLWDDCNCHPEFVM